MKKKIIIALLLFALIINIGTINAKALEDREVKISINGKLVESDVAPFIKEGRTMVPIRLISETLGYDVDWDGDLFSVTVSKWDDEKDIFLGLFVLEIDSDLVVSYDLEKLNKIFEDDIPTEEEIEEVMDKSAIISKIDVPATIVNGRTFVPLRFIAEAMGEKVDWDPNTWTAIIESQDK